MQRNTDFKKLNDDLRKVHDFRIKGDYNNAEKAILLLEEEHVNQDALNRILIEKAMIHLAKRKMSEAIGVLEQIIRKNTGDKQSHIHTSALLNLYHCYVKQNRLDKQRETLVRILKQEDSRVVIAWIEYYLRSEEFNEAQKKLDILEKLPHSSADAYYAKMIGHKIKFSVFINAIEKGESLSEQS